MKLGSLFDGIGGFPLSGVRHGITPVWASEIEPWPIKVTEKHFPDMVHLGDITKINGAEIEPVDIITFGSPCQDLSVAGKRAGLEGQRSGLFMDAVRIIREMRAATDGCFPRYAIWENVPGAYSSNGGQDFRAVLEEIAEAEIPMPTSGKWAEAGMVRTERVDVAWRTLDAQYWGVPQRRKRIFLVADFAGQCAGEILFEREGLRGNLAESREEGQEATGDAGVGIKDAMYWDGGQISDCLDEVIEPQLYDMTHANEVIRLVESGLAPTLNSRMGTGGNQVPIIMEPMAVHQNQCGEVRLGNMANTLNTNSNPSGRNAPIIAFKYAVRRLTPLECLRLQGYPDWWLDIEGMSDTAKYKAVGNSVAVPCVEFVMSGIARCLR